MLKYITILISLINIIGSNFIGEKSLKQDARNILNKGVWMRNKVKTNYNQGTGDFIFRENSKEIDNLLHNHFEVFGENSRDIPFYSAFIERQKRSSHYKVKKRPRKSINGKTTRAASVEYDNSNFAKSKLVNNLKPASVFNDYPYEVAILLNSNKIFRGKPKNQYLKQNDTIANISNNTVNVPTDIDLKNSSNEARNLTSKRSMKYNMDEEYIENTNKTNDPRNTYNQENFQVPDNYNVNWQLRPPIAEASMYQIEKFVPKEPKPKSKTLTERALIKVISMLTKTFKKITRQHDDIKNIHTKIADTHDEFVKKSTDIQAKIHDFDQKYLDVLRYHEKLKAFNTMLVTKEGYFKDKAKEITQSFKEFENQQKKFLLQQKQFYDIQKLMLAQNEKINQKQNLIAKTQSEISHRQNNFARILKKAKQLYADVRKPINKLSPSIAKLKDISKHKPTEKTITHTTTYTTNKPDPTTPSESVKINLFSIPTTNKIQENPDEQILKDKDSEAIDDLVYKYYFNNTFIDNIMRNKILNNFATHIESTNHVRAVKNKRNELETTILLPVLEAKESEIYKLDRARRWINHHSRHKNKRRGRGKDFIATVVNTTDEKLYNNIPIEPFTPTRPPVKREDKADPFLKMAMNFCNEINRNFNQQMLGWCIEKALRRLQILESNIMPSQPPSTMTPKQIEIQKPYLTVNMIPLIRGYTEKNTAPIIQTVHTYPSSPTTISKVTDRTELPAKLTSPTVITTNAYTNVPKTRLIPDYMHFPDNDELELKLKQYEIRPDTEGNVYYDGSLHESDVLPASDSEGVDDIMPGLDSNSRVQVDPIAYDVQARRRAFIRKMNERIKKSLG